MEPYLPGTEGFRREKPLRHLREGKHEIARQAAPDIYATAFPNAVNAELPHTAIASEEKSITGGA